MTMRLFCVKWNITFKLELFEEHFKLAAASSKTNSAVIVLNRSPIQHDIKFQKIA